MALTFTRIPQVTIREKPRSQNLWHLANGVIERVLSGLGNPTKRLGILFHRGLFVQLQAANPLGFLPPQSDFWTRFQAREPGDGDPFFTAHSGEASGPNTRNPLMLFLYGVEAFGFQSERKRLQSVKTTGSQSPWGLWELAKEQRGAFDVGTGERAAPFLDLSESFAQIRYNQALSPYGLGFGGMLPTAEDDIANPCDPDEDGFVPPNKLIFFTRLSDGATVTFLGTCPEVSGHIAGISYQPFGTYVFLNNGALYYFPKAEWIEGPYTGNSQLKKQDAQMLSRVQSYHAGEYRGTAEQRTASDGGLSASFHTQLFGTRQFALAPQAGTSNGATVTAEYTAWTASGAISAGASLTRSAGQDAWPAGTVCHGWAATATGLSASLTLQLKDGADILATITLVPDGSGNAEALQIFTADLGRLSAASVVAVQAVTATTLTVEASALLAYKPLPHDWFAVCRLAQWSDVLTLDGRGVDCDAARTISDNILESGCVLSLAGGESGFPEVDPDEEQPVNQSGLYDSARRFSKLVRFFSRAQFVDMALEDGKTVLWFARYGGDDVVSDLFHGIGPATGTIASGSLLIGRRYIVASGSITYDGEPKMTGDIFTATATLTFTGDGTVMEADGIERIAIPSHFSNRWVLDVDAIPYHIGEGSLWNPPEYYDAQSPLLSPEHIGSSVFRYSLPHKRHFCFENSNTFPPIYPEGVDAYTYAPTPESTHSDPRENWLNCSGDPTCEALRINFYKSRRLYEPPVEIESVTREVSDEFVTPLVDHGTELVKVTLRSRLHHHESAPDSFTRDRSTWDLAALDVECDERRTRENALREYLLHADTGRGCSNLGAGNVSLNVGAELDADYPEGSCYPWFQFTRLPGQPYLDGNDTLDAAHDTRMESESYRDIELWIHAMASGFVDSATSAQAACDRYTADGTTDYGPYCFTYDSLFYQAAGNRWPSWFPDTVRADNPYSHGPSPAQYHYAVHHNLLAAAINELTIVPIWLPMALEAKLDAATGIVNTLVGQGPCGYDADCAEEISGHFASAVAIAGTMPTPTGGTFAEYATGDTITLTANLTLGFTSANCDGTLWNVYAANSAATLRWASRDDSHHALTDDVAALLETNPIALIAKLYSTTRCDRVDYVDVTEAQGIYTVGGEGSAFCTDESAYAVIRSTVTTWTRCELTGTASTPTLVLPALPGGLIGNYSSGGSSPLFTKLYGPESSVAGVLLSDGSAMVRVPLVDPDPEDGR